MCVLSLMAISLKAASAAQNEPTTVPPGYRLVWADEFDGPRLDVSQWNYRIGPGHHSYQRPENVSLENGAVRIALKRESFSGKSFTGGGIITRKAYESGYFETRAKMFGGYGWHEAFWTMFINSLLPNHNKVDPQLVPIEIDCFEQFASRDMHTFSYGIIEWSGKPLSISRDSAKVEPDLSQAFHTYGFEVTPDFVTFFFDGRLLRSTDMRGVRQCPFYVWLTAIATKRDADPNGACWFDYLRIYAINPEEYEKRKVPILAKFDAEMGPIRSLGTDLWIEAEDFSAKGGWIVDAEQNTRCLRGHAGANKVKSEGDRIAATRIDIPQKGDYTLWVRSRDFSKGSQGKRTFRVGVGQHESQGEFGAHGRDGWAWQKGDSFHLEQGPIVLRLIDTGAYFGRCDKLLLTTDPSFTPAGKGARGNVKHR